MRNKDGFESFILTGDFLQMAITGNTFNRQTNSRQEDAASLDQQIGRLEDDIRKLKIDFDIYFNGSTKRPPLEAKARLDANMKRLADNRNLTYAQRYQFNAVVSRFNSYREHWRRLLKTRGEEIA